MSKNKAKNVRAGKKTKSKRVRPNNARKISFAVILLGIVLIALALRLGTAFELQAANHGMNSVNTPPPVTDMATYKRLAELISQGDFQDPFYLNNAHKYQPFYNSVFLPLVFLTFGYSTWAVLIAQCLIGAATVYLVGISTAKIWNRQAAILAAVMTAFSQILIFYTPYMLVATLQAFWLVLLFYCSVTALKSGRKLHWVVCALIASCAVLSRGNVWFLIPGIMGLAVYSLVFRKHGNLSGKRKTAYSLLVCLVFLLLVILPQIPFAWRNSLLLGRFCGPSSDAPVVLSLGNTPEAPPGGREEGWGPGPMEYPVTYSVWTAKESPVSVPVRIWRWVKREPLAYIELSVRKLLLFWDYREIPNNVSLDFALKQSDYLSYGFLGSVFILIPALAGIYVLIWRSVRKRDLKVLLLLYFVLAYCAATVAFYILARFRAPLIPLLAMLGAIFVNRVWRMCKNDQRHLYIPYIAAVSVSVFICFLAYDTYRFKYEAAVMREVRPDGIRVPLDRGKVMYLDSGPRTFGGWRTMPFYRGADIVKKFSVKNFPANAEAEFEILLLFAAPGEATLRVNGKERRVIAKHAGGNVERFKIQLPSTGRVTFRMLSATCNVFFLVDTQRYYKRSFINDDPMKCEVVCRLYLTPSETPKRNKDKKDAGNGRKNSTGNSPVLTGQPG
jgi:hypothetical protein